MLIFPHTFPFMSTVSLPNSLLVLGNRMRTLTVAPLTKEVGGLLFTECVQIATEHLAVVDGLLWFHVGHKRLGSLAQILLSSSKFP